jgi:hypothetical protein
MWRKLINNFEVNSKSIELSSLASLCIELIHRFRRHGREKNVVEEKYF